MEEKYKYKVFAHRGDGNATESRLEYKGSSILKVLKAIIQLRIKKVYCIVVELY